MAEEAVTLLKEFYATGNPKGASPVFLVLVQCCVRSSLLVSKPSFSKKNGNRKCSPAGSARTVSSGVGLCALYLDTCTRCFN